MEKVSGLNAALWSKRFLALSKSCTAKKASGVKGFWAEKLCGVKGLWCKTMRFKRRLV